MPVFRLGSGPGPARTIVYGSMVREAVTMSGVLLIVIPVRESVHDGRGTASDGYTCC